MCSAPASDAATGDDPDRTGRARIRDAAMARFAEDGVEGTSLRRIAKDAGVSASLVVHHYGSKEALREVCDDHVVATIRERKRAAVAAGPSLDPMQALREAHDGPPLLRYLARRLVEGGPQVDELVDEMVADAVGYMAEGVETGLLRPSDRPRERALVLTIWSLGSLVLHQHITRLLGTDLTSDTDGMVAWAAPAAEILAEGVFAEGFYERVREALGHRQEGS